MKPLTMMVAAMALLLVPAAIQSQPFDIYSFDPTQTGPWSEPGRTTLMVPRVANGSIHLDGSVTAQEYGGLPGTTVTPGVNAWILDSPDDRNWNDEADSSFTFFLAHDDDYFYVGVQVMDDVVNSDDLNTAFWKDDAIEIIVDALNDRLDVNTDSSQDPYGGHSYVNYEGRFSSWDDAAGQKSNMTWANAVDWKYGANDEVFGSGNPATGGWQVEVRFKKSLFEDPTAGNKLKNGYRMGFNIGIDDDDKMGPGANGDGSRAEDLEIQYWWANRQRREGLTADYLASLSDEDKQTRNYLADFSLVLDGNGRLAHGGTGEILFGYDTPTPGRILFVTSDGNSPINADPSMIALLRARGYSVTVFTANNSTPEDLRTAAQGQDVVFISETIGSTTVLDPPGDGTGIFSLQDVDLPVISAEAYMYDNADWVTRTEDGSNNFAEWGNSGRIETDEFGIGDARDSMYIQNSSHPITAGLTGKVKVYSELYSFNYGRPSPEADVLASLEPDGSYPTLFVYEKGDKLSDGSVAPNKRIGFFLGQAADPTTNYAPDLNMLNETGLDLLFKTISYAIGAAAVPSPSLSIAREGTAVIVTFDGGQLESADSVSGPWTTQSGTSPLTIQSNAARKFYRVKG